jgi:type III restriction enzyme
MGLDKTFPKSPYSILHPSVRWFPGEDVADPQSLMPPLVPKIREAVYKWREDGYPNVSDVTRALLKHWFVNGHESGFQYYFAQRESVESIIYLYEAEKIRNPSELLRFDSSGVLVESMFDEQWVRLVAKQATGTGKTKVLSLLIVWAYFHKLYIENSELSQNFLLLAPNTIVLDRLKTDIEGLRVFRADPALPPNNYEGRMWSSDFNPKVHIQDNIGSISRTGNIFLTNIQRFSNRTKSADKSSSMDYFLGEKPVAKTSDNKITVKDIVKNLDNLIVLNDEAHHIHDSKMAWFKTIENINSSVQNMPIQIDVTATPKNQNGEIFIQTISDYPLVEAIEQDVVKKPILPDEASLGKLSEHDSSKFSERWRDYIDLGVTVWQQDYEKHKKLEGKKALLFIMVDDTKNCDEVRDYLENSFPILKNSTFVIHTNKEGEIDENPASKSQKDLIELRDMANKVDSNDNEIKAIISVLMLKEGWDVRNVTTVVGLRPFSAKANILPEQALGRGLRKMYFGSGFQEELNVVGSEGFIEFVKSIKREGVILEERSMGKGSEASGPTIIEVDKTKDIKDLDIEIPVLTNRIQRDHKDLNLLNPDAFEFKKSPIKIFTPEQHKNIVFRDIIHDIAMKEVKFGQGLKINATSIVTFFTNSIMSELRLSGGKDIIYGKLKYFIKYLLFGEEVDLESPNIACNLSDSVTRENIKNTFKLYINKLTVVDKGTTEVINHIKISNIKTFAVARTLETFNNPQKSLFNKIVGDSNFELQFAGFLDATVDVKAFVKNFQKLNFQMTYQKHDGSIGSYFPDFTVKLKNGDFYVVETKGAENLDDPRKIDRLKVWCEDATKAEGKNWNCLYIKQEDWERLGQTPNSFAEIIDLFKV